MASALPEPLILVVDDDPGLSFLIEQTLRREQWRVSAVNSGAAAMKWIENDTPGLILLDLRLQDIGASDLIGRLAAVGRLPPFIIITGQGHEKVAVEMMKRGALDYVTKDAQFLDLLPEIVRHALKQIDQQRRLVAAEDSLWKSERNERARAEELAALLDAVQLPILIAHDSECRHITGNRAADELLRHRRGSEASLTAAESERPRHFKAMKHGQEIPTDELPAQKAARGLPVNNFEFSLLFDDGTERQVLAYAMPLWDENKRPRGAVNVLVDITERKRMESQLLEIAEREQVRIGQELHDGLGQQLTAIEFLCESLKGDIRRTNPDLVPRFEQIAQFLRGAISETRLISHGLAPIKMTSDGLMDSLQQLAGLVSKTGRLKCTLKCPEPVLIADSSISCHFFRIAQEAANNAMKHAQAKNIVIRLAETPDSIRLAISNDGAGFKAPGNGQKGIGLEVMRHRANVIGARLDITSIGGGTTVSCQLLKKYETNGKGSAGK